MDSKEKRLWEEDPIELSERRFRKVVFVYETLHCLKGSILRASSNYSTADAFDLGRVLVELLVQTISAAERWCSKIFDGFVAEGSAYAYSRSAVFGVLFRGEKARAADVEPKLISEISFR